MRSAIALFLALGACAAAPAPDDDAFAELAGLEQRVATVAYRLTTANADLCAEKSVQTGLTLHDAAQYAPASRADAQRYFGLGSAPGVLAVAAGSPAEAAGLRVGDAILATEAGSLGHAVAAGAPASLKTVEAARDQIERDLADGAADLQVLRNGQQTGVRLRPAIGCAWRVQLVPSSIRRASADGRIASVTTAFARYAADDDDLALVIGHEMAHNLLHHRLDRTGSQRSRERAADYVGLYLTARAGYDVSGAQAFLLRYGEDDWRARLGVLTHPSPTTRSKAAAAAVAEIERKRAAGQPLIPAATPPAY